MKKTKNKLPINRFLSEHSRKKVVRFHMPGHNGGQSVDKELRKKLLSYDITEIKGADNLLNPDGIIKSSQNAIAKKRNCISSYYLVNGASSGIMSVLKYIAEKKGGLLVSRDCHKSVIKAALLFSVKVSFAWNEYNDTMQLFSPLSLEEIKEEITLHKDIKYVLLTSPNYYGFVADIRKIAAYLHDRGVLLIVDQAHGSHFIHSPQLPDEAISLGADIVIESVHKTLPAINQSALLHHNSKDIDEVLLSDIIHSLTTSSPSYIMMAMMEKAILSDYSKAYEKLYQQISNFKKRVKFHVLENDDFSRVVVDVSKSSMTGYQVSSYLADQNIYVEMADYNHIVLITHMFQRKKDFQKLIKALDQLPYYNNQGKIMLSYPRVKKAMELKQSYEKKKKSIDLDRAEGQICGTIIIPYPPGIPLLCFGEIIDRNSINCIKLILKNNGEVIGIHDNKINIIEV